MIMIIGLQLDGVWGHWTYQTICSNSTSACHPEDKIHLPPLKIGWVFGPYLPLLAPKRWRDANTLLTGYGICDEDQSCYIEEDHVREGTFMTIIHWSKTDCLGYAKVVIRHQLNYHLIHWNNNKKITSWLLSLSCNWEAKWACSMYQYTRIHLWYLCKFAFLLLVWLSFRYCMPPHRTAPPPDTHRQSDSQPAWHVHYSDSRTRRPTHSRTTHTQKHKHINTQSLKGKAAAVRREIRARGRSTYVSRRPQDHLYSLPL